MKKFTIHTTLLRTVLRNCSWAWLCVVSLFAFVACQQEEVGPATTSATITIGVDNTTATRSTAWTNPDLTNMSVTVFLCENGHIVAKTTTHGCDLSGDKTVSVDLDVLAGIQYDVCVWADFNQGFYTLADVGARPTMTLADNVVKGTLNTTDAYYGFEQKTFSGNDNIMVNLTRPFALVAVNTNNWSAVTSQPTTYSVAYTAPTRLDLITGEVSESAARTFSGAISAAAAEGDVKELSYDFFLASSTATTLSDFTVHYYAGSTEVSSYTFTNIQIQRNYKTNVTGKILQ